MRHAIAIFLAIAIIKRGVKGRVAAATVIRREIITFSIEGIASGKK